MNDNHWPSRSEAMHAHDVDISDASKTSVWLESRLAMKRNRPALPSRLPFPFIAAAAAVTILGVVTAIAVVYTKPSDGKVLPNVGPRSSSSKPETRPSSMVDGSPSAYTVKPIPFGGAEFQCGDNVLDYPVLSDIGLSYAFHHDASSSSGPDWIVLHNASSNRIGDLSRHVELLILDDSGAVISRSGILGSQTRETFEIDAGGFGSISFTMYGPGCVDSPKKLQPGRHPATLTLQATTQQNFTRLYRTNLFFTVVDPKGAVTLSS